MSKVTIKVKKLHPDAQLPTYAHKGDACADVYAMHGAEILPGYTVEFKTGLAFDIPDGWMIEARSRSSLSCKRNLLIPNQPSTVDAGYKGEFLLYLYNFGDIVQQINAGDRICQIRPVKVTEAQFEEVEELSESERGTGGFGSSGR